MRDLYRTLYGICIVSVLGSCNTQYYMPNMQQIPLLREEGEVRAAGALVWESSGHVGGFDMQGAYAVNDHLGVLMNLCHYFGGEGYDVQAHEEHGSLFELGAGRLQPLGKHWVAEGFGGIGRGGIVSQHPGTTTEANFWRLFIQPSIGYASRNFDGAVAARLCYLDHGDARMIGTDTDQYEEALNDMLNTGRFMFEPGATIRFGGRSWKIQLQYVYSINLSTPIPMLDDNYSVGLQFNINNSFPAPYKLAFP